jgi:hypothetical protein
VDSYFSSNSHGLIARRRAERPFSILAMGAIFAAALLPAAAALAEEIRITNGDCQSEVHLVARDARFSAVLQRLAEALDFRLSFEADSDPMVNVDAAMPPGALLARLVPDANVSATEASDPRCPRLTRILKVWVLAKPRANRSNPPSPLAQVLPVQETPDRARTAQEGINMVLKAHGFDPTITEGSH